MTEKAPYEVIEKDGDLEIRSYPAIIFASVHGHPENDAFRKLFRYITGENVGADTIDMTVPVVVQARRGSRIPMTVPVVEAGDAMSFIMPSKFNATDVPRPIDRDVQIETVPPRRLAVLSFRGSARQKDVETKKEELLDLIGKKGLTTRGVPFEMYYNGPGVPGFLRHNEVAVEILG